MRDAATTVDERLGENYGKYARKTADAIENAAGSLRERDFSDMADDTREFVRKSPVMAVGAAAAFGFVLASLLRSGRDRKSVVEGKSVSVRVDIGGSSIIKKKK